ncbi:MAG TPA: ATP-binding protein [Polyangiales bacterium]|nr:ATP-binding protein [Polyangiales bacterium]
MIEPEYRRLFERQPDESWRDYKRRMRGMHKRPHRLRRQLFFGFGFAILITMMFTGFVSMVLWRAHAPTPLYRVVVWIIAGNVLWMFTGLLAHRLAWPLWELARAVKDFGSGKLDRRARLPRRSSREAQELAEAFNEMAGRIEALVRGQRELLGVVSHELRTPLARLRVLLAILQDREGESPLVAKFEREIIEMDALVGELLAEARISAQALTLTTLDLRDVATECAERLGITLVEAPQQIYASGDATLISRALTLLLDNALKHGGKQVRVRASLEDSRVRVCVEDDGPGIEPADLPKLFEAFSRGRGAAADERHGVGLGLYLVRRIAQAHGGDAFAENLPGAGARIGFSVASAPGP